MSKERPVLFSAPMVRAILEGRKTQTRRVMKPQPMTGGETCATMPSDCPFGQPGDRLWVRESFQYLVAKDCSARDANARTGEGMEINYIADNGAVEFMDRNNGGEIRDAITPSIHMPRWASRLTLEIIAVRVERLQEITVDDAKDEGVNAAILESAKLTNDACRVARLRGEKVAGSVSQFAALWDSIYGEYHNLEWAENPWVWVIEFRRVE